jgi:hypothetical protein
MAIDRIGELRRIMSKDANETFDRTTDSLEALRDWLTIVLGVGPGVGLWMFGVCDPAMAASTNTIVTNNLANMPEDVFNGQFWMQVILNHNAHGVAPEGEFRRIANFVAATQTFTVDAFSANVEANDLLCIVHESLISHEILGVGTLSTNSATVPADNTRIEANNYFRGCVLMPTEGVCRFQPRLIVGYTGAGGIFTLDPGNPFTAAPGLVDYVILRGAGGVSGTIAPTNGVYAHPSGVGEQIAFTVPAVGPIELKTLYLDLVNLTQNCTIRVYYQIDGANYRQIDIFNWTVAMGDGVYFREIAVNAAVQVTVQSAVAEGAVRNIPYQYLVKA